MPGSTHDKVTTSKYQVRMPPNGRLAGLVRKQAEEDGQPLVPFAFAEVKLDRVPAGTVPRLRTTLRGNEWVFNWDQQRKTGYLLVVPPRRRLEDRSKLRFEVKWIDTSVARRAPGKPAGGGS
jgi:hypothetical protein